MKLIRVAYGKKDTPAGLREYRIDGKGPVGTIPEFVELYQGCKFEIEDDISK